MTGWNAAGWTRAHPVRSPAEPEPEPDSLPAPGFVAPRLAEPGLPAPVPWPELPDTVPPDEEDEEGDGVMRAHACAAACSAAVPT